MTIDQLRFFTAVVQEDGFLEGAERCSISQSSLSKQIMKMEDELGVKLFDRSHRKAELTEAGRFFYPDAVKTIEQYDSAVRRLRQKMADNLLHLNVAALPFGAQYHLSELFQGFAGIHPEIALRMEETEEVQLLQGLDTGKYDCAVMREAMEEGRNDLCVPIASDELVFVAGNDNPLLRKERVRLKEVCRYPLMLMNPYTSICHLVMDLFDRENLEPDIRGHARCETILSYVAGGRGVSLLPESVLSVFSHEGVESASLDPPMQLKVILAVPRERGNSRHIKEFLDYVKTGRWKELEG